MKPTRPSGTRSLRQLVRVLALSDHATRGFVALGALQFACALGRGGSSARKREGDGATPKGQCRIGTVYYRADRVRRPRTAMPARALRPSDGWCDAPADRNYNRFVRHPYPASAERLWRRDALYDLVCVLSYNERPRVRGRGSAIFMHVARAGYAPTEGCIALRRPHLLRVIAGIKPGAVLQVGASHKKRPELSRRAFRSTYRGSGVL